MYKAFHVRVGFHKKRGLEAVFVHGGKMFGKTGTFGLIALDSGVPALYNKQYHLWAFFKDRTRASVLGDGARAIWSPRRIFR